MARGATVFSIVFLALPLLALLAALVLPGLALVMTFLALLLLLMGFGVFIGLVDVS